MRGVRPPPGDAELFSKTLGGGGVRHPPPPPPAPGDAELLSKTLAGSLPLLRADGPKGEG